MPSSTKARGAPSRRGLIQGATACALPFPPAVANRDPAFVLAQQWCWLEEEQRRLIHKWQLRESWLFKHRNWPNLSEAEQDAVSEGAELRLIDDQLGQIDELYDALLPKLKSTAATTREGLLARFDALLHFVPREENPDGRALLQSCLGGLRRLWP